MNRRYQPDTPENREYLEELRNELLRFGRSFPSPSGASYYLGSDGSPLKDRDLETWITCRMAHVYSLGSLLGFALAFRYGARVTRRFKPEILGGLILIAIGVKVLIEHLTA